MLQSFLREGFI
uniref:Uncharacterized protein n=1 Tax=Anguilla anguilla TaxID=7936 RepID=A0A0E9TA37_ANGAN